MVTIRSMMMKGLVTLLVILLASVVLVQSRTKAEWKKLAATSRDECRSENKITETNMTVFFETSTDSSKKCQFLTCHNEKMLGPTKSLDELNDKIEAFIEDFHASNTEKKNKLLGIQKLCRDKTGEDDCDSKLLMMKCHTDHLVKLEITHEFEEI